MNFLTICPEKIQNCYSFKRLTTREQTFDPKNHRPGLKSPAQWIVQQTFAETKNDPFIF